MKLFGQFIRTVVNTAVLPVAVVKDIITLGGVATDQDATYIGQAIERLKDEADEDADDDEE